MASICSITHCVFQGFHDIVVTFLLVVGEELTFAIMDKLCQNHLRLVLPGYLLFYLFFYLSYLFSVYLFIIYTFVDAPDVEVRELNFRSGWSSLSSDHPQWMYSDFTL